MISWILFFCIWKLIGFYLMVWSVIGLLFCLNAIKMTLSFIPLIYFQPFVMKITLSSIPLIYFQPFVMRILICSPWGCSSVLVLTYLDSETKGGISAVKLISSEYFSLIHYMKLWTRNILSVVVRSMQIVFTWMPFLSLVSSYVMRIVLFRLLNYIIYILYYNDFDIITKV